MKGAYVKYLAALLLFGSNGVVAGLISLNSYEIVLLRSVLGSLMLAAIFLALKGRLSIKKYKRDFFFIVLSGISMAADWLFLFEAYARIGVSLGMLINYSGPVIVMALSVPLFNEKLTVNRVAALIGALAGVFLIGGGAFGAGTDPVGFLFAVLSAFSYAAMVLFSKKSENITGMENSLIQLVSTCAVVAVFVGAKQGLSIDVPKGDWPAVLWLGLVNTGAACYLYFSSIGRLPAQTVAVCGYLEPLSAVVFAALILSETMSPIQYVGAVLIIFGALTGEGVFGKNKYAFSHRKKGISG